MTSLDRHITRCPTRLQATCPDLPLPLLSARRSGFLSCLHETKGVSFRLQRCHRFCVCKTSWSTRHRTAAFSTAMNSSTPHHIEIIEGSQLQERPDSTNEMFLYTHVLCPYAQTAWLTLLQLGVPHQVVHIDLSSKPAWFTQLCKNKGFSATVPVIDCDGEAQNESVDICRWLCDRFQDPEFAHLTFSNPQDKHHMDALITQRQGFKNAGMDLLAGTTSSPFLSSIKAKIELQYQIVRWKTYACSQWKIGTKQSKGQWKAFEEHLLLFQAAINKGGGRFLMGHEVSLADLLYFPFMERFALAMPEFTGYDPCDACDGVMSAWLEAMMQLTSCQLASPDAKLFQQAIRQQRSLDFFDYSTYSAYQLHPHLQ